jgi:hypothetical protein
MNAVPTARYSVATIIYWTLFALWGAAAVGLMLLGLMTYTSVTADSTPTMLSEQRLVVHIGMVVLGFPVNFFVPGYLSDLLKPYGYELFSVSHPGALPFVRDWAIMALLGWLQWFVLLPAIFRLFRGRPKNEAAV